MHHVRRRASLQGWQGAAEAEEGRSRGALQGSARRDARDPTPRPFLPIPLRRRNDRTAEQTPRTIPPTTTWNSHRRRTVTKRICRKRATAALSRRTARGGSRPSPTDSRHACRGRRVRRTRARLPEFTVRHAATVRTGISATATACALRAVETASATQGGSRFGGPRGSGRGAAGRSGGGFRSSQQQRPSGRKRSR